MKRNISILLTAVMLLAMVIPAQAAGVAKNPEALTDRASVIETLYELEGELYGLVSCSYGIFEKTVGYGFAV